MPSTTTPVPRGADFSVQISSERPRDEQGFPLDREYGGLPVLADGIDIHERAFELISKHVPKSGRILDVGAGTGSFSKRLIDQGYAGTEAVEFHADWFQVPGVPVHALDLQDDWAAKLPAPADAVVSLEVIEHLENPWHFARQCALAVKPGGVIVLSTPNIQSSRSRLQFLMNAEFRFFRQKDYEAIGHITSLTQNQIRQVFEAAGCEPVEQARSRHKGILRPRSPRKAFQAAVYALAYPLMRGPKHGEVGLYVFRKSA